MTTFAVFPFYVTSYTKRQPWTDTRVDVVEGESEQQVRASLKKNVLFADRTIVNVSTKKPRDREPPMPDLTQVSDEAIAAELARRKEAKDEAEKVRRKERHALVVKHALVLAEFVPFHYQENGKFLCNDDNLASVSRRYSARDGSDYRNTPKCSRCWLLSLARSPYNDDIDVTLRFEWSPADLRTLEDDRERERSGW
jgi:hypothetical protein